MSPHLKIREIFALSQSDGKDPSCKDFEKVAYRKGAISRQSFCSSRGQIWPGPGALSGIKLCSNLMMSLTEILNSCILGYWLFRSSGVGSFPGCNDLHHEGLALFRQICFRSRGDLGVKTDWNWLFSKLAFFTLSVHICPLSFRGALPWLSWQQFLR